MKLNKFTFSPFQYATGGIITLGTKDLEIEIYDRHADYNITELLQGILDTWKENKQLVKITFEHDHGWYDIILINYPPGDILKVEIYDTAPWDFFDEVDTMPPPLFIDYTTHYSLAYFMIQGIEEAASTLYRNPQCPYPDEKIKELRKMMGW